MEEIVDMTATQSNKAPVKAGLLDRLKSGPVICAEGYLFELERRGYLQAGAFVPEAVVENPEVVKRLHEDFVHAGSDVVEAFTYYAHRQKLRVIGRESILEDINRQALRIARDVADRHGCLMAGDICNTNAYEADDEATHATVRAMFEEQIAWAVDERADFLIAETIDWCGEAEIALDVMKRTGLPAVVTLSAHRDENMFDGVPVAEACKRLEAAGADVVGLNCQRGPTTLMTIVRRVREAVSCHSRRFPSPIAPPRRSRRSSRLPTEAATAFRAAARFRPCSIRSPATATNARNSRANVSRSTCDTSGSAVAPRPLTSARSPRPSAALCRVVAIRRTCPSAPSSGPMQPFRIATRTAAPKSSL